MDAMFHSLPGDTWPGPRWSGASALSGSSYLDEPMARMCSALFAAPVDEECGVCADVRRAGASRGADVAPAGVCGGT
jgi:hypothetical protein